MQFLSVFQKLKKVQLSFKLVRRTEYLKNVFSADHPKKVLISYLSSAFTKGISDKHTSLQECYTAARIFDELGYTVDVVDFDDENRVKSFAAYDGIYGFGTPYEKSFHDKQFKGKRILYSTGCNSNFTNLTTTKRLKEFYQKTGILDPQLIRTVDDAWPLQKYLSDSILSLGNKFVADTYRVEGVPSEIFEIDLFYPKSKAEHQFNAEKYETIKNNLIWFGSKSSVHKGLDIALDLLKLFPDLKLYICGYDRNYEIELYNYYKSIFDSEQVVDCGFVNIHSSEFASLLNSCGAAIFPTAAEGGAAALLTLMGNSGVIPITTKNAGLDLSQLGYISENVSLEGVADALRKYLNTPNHVLEQKRVDIKNYIQNKHDYQVYYQAIKNAISTTLNRA